MTEQSRMDEAREYVKSLREFYNHLAVYLIVCGMLVFINLESSPGYFWAKWPIIGWGIGVLFHGLGAFNVSILGKRWEERKIREYLDTHPEA